MKLAYRTILTTKMSFNNRKKLEDAVKHWFVETKGFSTGSRPIVLPHDPGRTTYVTTDLEGGYLSGWEMLEPWGRDSAFDVLMSDPDLNAKTQIMIFPYKGLLYLWMDIYSPSFQIRDNQKVERQAFSATPRLITDLLSDSSMEFKDADYPVTGAHHTITSVVELDNLEKYLINPQRRMSVYLAVAPSEPESGWAEKVDEVTKFSQGLALTVTLSPSMRNKFHGVSGKTHSIPNGGIRTFAPGVTFDDYYDGYRHKLLSRETLFTRRTENLRRALRETLANRATTHHVDDALIEIKEKFETRTREELRRSFGHSKTENTESSSQGLVELAKEVEEWERYAEELERQRGEDNAEIKRMSKELEILQDVLDENWALQQEVENLRDVKINLQTRLLDTSKSSEVFVEEHENPVAQLPISFSELIERLHEISYLDFRGDEKQTIELQSKALAIKSANDAWKILRSLSSYAEFKENGLFEGSFREFVRKQPSGSYCAVKPGQLNSNESESTLNNSTYRKQRQIGVPAEVQQDEIVVCTEHIDINNTRRAGSARIYFYDATRINGIVYIGPISEHLDNSSTN
jgi:hypothetical protein